MLCSNLPGNTNILCMTVLDSYMKTGENAKTRADAEHWQRQDVLYSHLFTEKLPGTLSICTTDSPLMAFFTLSHFTSSSGASGNRKGWDTERHCTVTHKDKHCTWEACSITIKVAERSQVWAEKTDRLFEERLPLLPSDKQTWFQHITRNTTSNERARNALLIIN